MTRTIRRGDRVYIYLSEKGPVLAAGTFTVDHAACNTGDLWYFHNDVTGNAIALNPQSAALIGFMLVERAAQEEGDEA